MSALPLEADIASLPRQVRLCQSRPNAPQQKSAWFTWRIEWWQRQARSARSTIPRARAQHAAGNLDNRHVGIVCAASAHVNVSVLYQLLTPPAGLGPLASPRGGFPFRSGSAWLGRSQKDGLPSYRGGTYFIAVQGHRLAHKGQRGRCPFF